jgi:predicted AlkP superfamily pyrophosphatase or phosphodiesterase
MTLAPQKRERRAVVFGIDGVRADVLKAARTPVIDDIISKGCFTTFEFDAVTRAISGPGWATVATGVPYLFRPGPGSWR